MQPGHRMVPQSSSVRDTMVHGACTRRPHQVRQIGRSPMRVMGKRRIGRQMASTLHSSQGAPAMGDGVYVADTATVRLLVDDDAHDANNPKWSPDGQRIAFMM